MGRRHELAQLRRLLATARLVTLTGVGGGGKTRLALRVAAQVGSRFRDGVRLADLASLTDGSLLECQLAEVLGIRDRAGRGIRQCVVDFLRERDMLLILDNCEHLLDACARLAGQALRAAAGLRVLCTSRQPLGVIGEHIVVVPPLPVPDDGVPFDVEVDRRYPALALFVRRARVVRPTFRLAEGTFPIVAEICRRVDGLPLAIELAASRLRTQTVDQLAAGLFDCLAQAPETDRPASRHATLNATFDWSYELCSPRERLLWKRVCVFAGSFDLAAAEQVCADGELPAGDLLHVLAGLVDKSVVNLDCAGGQARYRLLNTVRRYGMSRLPAMQGPGELDHSALRTRRADHYRNLSGDAWWAGFDHRHRQVQRVELDQRFQPTRHAGLGKPGEAVRSASPGRARRR